MFAALLRGIVVVVVLVAAIAFFLGYRWSDLAAPGRDVDRPAIGGAAGRPDVSGVRERSDRAGAALETTAERAGRRASEAAAEAGELLSDASLTAKIKSKMALDDHISAGNIGVKTKDGHVTLSGVVASDGEHRRAVELARDTKGVVSVDDRLTVQR